ncbi:MAG TPA: PEP-CTERM sorting domain-containing protein [Phycisphaerales bacterium]|nr:PEP-CTERM sorting domain-containing protein [Phycisphaerales bacterium]HRQ76427.1 PEP-CTERM sorting domain-containing protein [Phycisphaerales bacterium]
MKKVLGILGAGALALGAFAQGANADLADTYVFDVSGIFSNDGFGAAINEVFLINLGENAHIVGLDWDVTLFADSPSWRSEMIVTLSDSTGLGGINLAPAAGVNSPGTGTYSGSADLVDLGLDFVLGADGLLRLEFWESFVDYAGDWDGIWESGTLTIHYKPIPAPGALALLGVAGLAGIGRRRRA